jgi:hypothetical protein
MKPRKDGAMKNEAQPTQKKGDAPKKLKIKTSAPKPDGGDPLPCQLFII